MTGFITVKNIKPKMTKSKNVRLEILSELNKMSREMIDDYKATTRTWETDVKFEVVKEFNKNDISLLVGTNNLIYQFVDGGTKPHVIKAKTPYGLAFNSKGFKPKTSPNNLNSSNGRKANSGFVRPQQVKHPGIEPRNFSREISRKFEKQFPSRIQSAINRGLKKDGLL